MPEYRIYLVDRNDNFCLFCPVCAGRQPVYVEVPDKGPYAGAAVLCCCKCSRVHRTTKENA